MDILTPKHRDNNDGTSTPFIAIDSTDFVKEIGFVHQLIHDGNGFHLSGKISSLANGSSYNILLNTGNTETHLLVIHMDVTGAPCDIYIFEDTTVSSNGTTLSIHNTNRIKQLPYNGGAYHTPIVTGDGTQIDYHLLNGAKQSGGSSEVFDFEWVLKPNSNYLCRLMNNSAGSIDAGYELFLAIV